MIGLCRELAGSGAGAFALGLSGFALVGYLIFAAHRAFAAVVTCRRFHGSCTSAAPANGPGAQMVVSRRRRVEVE